MGTLKVNGSVTIQDLLTLKSSTDAYTIPSIAFGNDVLIGYGSTIKNLGIYSSNKIYLRPNNGTLGYSDGIELSISSLIPTKNNTVTLGSSSNKWSNVYATTFIGALSGTASKATNLTISDGTADVERKILVTTEATSGQNTYSVPGVTANYTKQTLTAAGGFIGNLTGNAATATTSTYLATSAASDNAARHVYFAYNGDSVGKQRVVIDNDFKYNPSTNVLTVGSITGSAAKLTTARTIRTNLASTSTASFDGSANITPGVTGTLAVGNGGTGKTSFTAGYVVQGNGSSALKTTNAHINYSAGTTTADGYEELVLGNSTKTGVANNTSGRLALYSNSSAGVYLTAAATTGWNYTSVLPLANGTLLNTGNYTSYCAKASHTHSYVPLSGGTMSGNLTVGNLIIDTSGSIGISLSTTGGWARGQWYSINSTNVGGFGLYGSSTTVNYFYVGTYGSPWMSVSPAGTVTATKFVGSLQGNSTTCSYPAGFSGRETASTWGAVSSSSYTCFSQWVSGSQSDKGAIAFLAYPTTTQCTVKIDGFFYQNEGAYRCIDSNSILSATSGYTNLLAIHNKVTTTSTRSIAQSSWDGMVSGLKYMHGESFKDTSIGSDTGDIVFGVRAGQYTSGGTELCIMIDGDFYVMGHKVQVTAGYGSTLPSSGLKGEVFYKT